MPRTFPLRSSLAALAWSSALVLALPAAASAAPNVVVSIKPLHSLVASVMEGVGEPALLVEGAGSPHNYALRPSQAGSLQDADLVFWVGPDMETFLAKPLESIGGGQSVPLMDAALSVEREHEHSHDEGEHGHEDVHEHDHEEHAEADHDHGDGHHHEGRDPHVWLDPVGAQAMVHAIEDALSKADPENADIYRENAVKLEARLEDLTADVEARVAPIRDVPFVVFHDAYAYFADRFGVAPKASVTVSPERTPSAAHVAEVKKVIEDTNAVCVFAEPQFEPKLVGVLIEGTKARMGTLDPLGANIEAGPEAYDRLIENLADSLTGCLGHES